MDALIKLPDGTVKQRNQLTDTEVWTIPGRGHRPLSTPVEDPTPINPDKLPHYCAFCTGRYGETPPEKARILLHPQSIYPEHKLKELNGFSLASGLTFKEITAGEADFRRVPNLFEIVSHRYWQLNHQVEVSEHTNRLMAEYLAQPEGYDHVLKVVKAKLSAHGLGAEALDNLSEPELLQHAQAFFAGGHDLIIGKRHFQAGATHENQLASSGTLTPKEHFAYISLTVAAMQDLYNLNPYVKYVSVFQNWLKPAGASFDHLHKQLVAIDEYPVQIQSEEAKIAQDPQLYEEILRIRATRGLIIAQNDYAIAMAGIGHRYPTIAIWPLFNPENPWEASPEKLQAVSDMLHAIHAATGADVPCNEEWYHRPPSLNTPLRWRILVKWRISTLAGFEGGTRIYLNTIDPWEIHKRMVASLLDLRVKGLIAPMLIGAETQVEKNLLYDQV